MERLAGKLAECSLVALDTAIFIYQFEKNNRYFKLTKEIFSRLDEDADFVAITSIITLLEVLVKPFKELQSELAEQYAQKLLYDEKLTTWMINGNVAKKAAEIRAKYGIKTPAGPPKSTPAKTTSPTWTTPNYKRWSPTAGSGPKATLTRWPRWT